MLHSGPGWVKRYRKGVVDSYRYLRPNLFFIAVFGAVSHPAYYLYVGYTEVGEFDSPVMRLVAVLAIVPLIFFRRLEKAGWGDAMPFLCVVAIGIALPFYFTFELLIHAAFDSDPHRIHIWQLQHAFSLTALVLCIYDRRVMLSVLLLATLSAFAIFSIDHASAIFGNGLVTHYYRLIPFFGFVVFAGMYFNRSREVYEQEKLGVAKSIGSAIAHELRTPLFAINAKSQGVRAHLSTLVDAYVASTSSTSPGYIGERKLALLSSAMDDISKDVVYANSFIDMLLISSRSVDRSFMESEDCLASDVVEDAVSRFPYANDHERDLVNTDILTDFTISAPKLIVVHVVMNLLKNAIYHVQAARKGVVVVRVDERYIVVRDTGPGIDPKLQGRIFEQFFTTLKIDQGSGIGLSFCLQAVRNLGGNITCRSVFGEYTEMWVKFPRRIRLR